MKQRLGRQRGVTLIEALLALLVMAVGLLAMAGVQATLRTNGDLSKQRSEASRLAQRAIESARNYSSIASSGNPGDRSYDGIVSATSTVTGDNATYSVTTAVSDVVFPGMKTVNVTVSWEDRAGLQQSVTLSTSITRVAPEFAGTLAAVPPGNPDRLPNARNAGIPRSAVDQGDGTSRFEPPGGGTLRWIFSNATGAITQACDPAPTCVTFNARLLQGFISFATASVQPTPAQAELPPSSTISGIEITVSQTYPSTATVACFEEASPQYIEYFCAVPVSASDTPPRWSGRSLLGGLALATSATDSSTSAYRVCRYTPTRAHTVVSASFPNSAHPLDYVNVSTPLMQQNFLVIRAGDGLTAFTCPGDDTTTPLINGNTFDHQPAS